MKVIVDTSVWSLALRHNSQVEDSPYIALLRDLITDGRVALLGAVRQEILSGIRHIDHYELLRNYLHAFPNLELNMEDYELASEFYNTCRHHGLLGTNTDFLICAAAVRRNYRILTRDQDFEQLSQYIPVTLFQF
ncbi:PIN domain-containing protein [Nostoc sp. UHCC 0702]|nr:PIN domain-containing protein [Nostoc sp. UHCC 0702]